MSDITGFFRRLFRLGKPQEAKQKVAEAKKEEVVGEKGKTAEKTGEKQKRRRTRRKRKTKMKKPK